MAKRIATDVDGMTVTWTRKGGFQIDAEQWRERVTAICEAHPAEAGERTQLMTNPAYLPAGIQTSRAARKALMLWESDWQTRAAQQTAAERAAQAPKRRRSAGLLPIVTL